MNTKLLYGSNAARLSFKLLFAFIFFLSMTGAHAQVSAYQTAQLQLASYTDLDPTTKTQIFTGAWDNAVAFNTPIGFTFKFNGINYNDVRVSPNGFVTFGTIGAGTTVYNPVSNTGTFEGAIAGYAYNWRVNTAVNDGSGNQLNSVSKFLDVSGGAGNSILKIEYRGVVRNATDPGFLSFQIWLYETTNVIEVRFNTQSSAYTVAINGALGLRGTSNADYNALFWSNASGVWPTAPTVMAAAAANSQTANIAGNLVGITAASNRLYRWTPVNCVIPSSVAVSSVLSSTATVTWTAPIPAPTQYQYEIRTSGAAGSGPAGLAQSGSTPASPLNLTGLSPTTTYTVYVRSDCGSFSAWTAGVSFTTLCTAQNIPYLQYFDPLEPGYTYAVPAIPPCSSTTTITGGAWTTATDSSVDGFFDEHVFYTGMNATANAWFYTQGVTLTGGQTYRLSYLYGGSTNVSHIVNKMMVRYGTQPNVAGQTNFVADHNNIKDSPLTNIINFTVPGTGDNVYYFSFQAYSAANQGYIFLDNIEVTDATCFQPTGVVAANETGTTALLTWNAPAPVPSNGYAYFVSTVNTPPSNEQVPSGFTTAGTTALTLTGLSPNTTYYFWVRGSCGFGDFSQWSTGTSFTTLNPPVYTYCTPAPTSQDGQGIVNVTMGSINNSTGLEPGGYANYSNLITNVSQGAVVPVNITFATGYTYYTRIWVDWNNDSDFSDPGEDVYNGQAAAPNPTTLNASITVPAGATLGEHRMRIGGADFDTLAGFGANQGPCYVGTWASFEDYTLNVVVPPPALTLNIASSSQCAGQPSPLVTITSPLSNYTTYSWSPTIGVSGDATSGYTFTSSTTITYTVTGIQTSAPFSTNTASFTYIANPLPTAIVITPSVPSACQGGPAVQLNASGGIVSGITILTEGFNGASPIPGWTTTNTSTGGTPAAAAWTLRPSGYNPGGSSGITSVISNDATQFYISNSDAQGIGSTTNVTLTSPVFSLVGYTNASMNFYHYYKAWSSGFAKVEIYSGGAWNPVPLLQWGVIPATQGAPTNFANVVYNLGAYVGQANLQIRFVYNSNWGYVWAIDNFSITGSATSAITWTPIAGLYSDAAATVPYVANTGAGVVYALPSSTTTYTASASTLIAPICSTSTNTTVTINTVTGGSVTPLTQNVCSAAAPLVLTGAVGTVTEWQYATNAAFTVGVTSIPSSASTTLSSANIGSFTGIRYYRAVITSGGCTGYSTIVSVNYAVTTWNGSAWSNGAPDSTKRAIFSGNYSSTANITACSVQVTSGNVLFNSGHVLNVTNEVTVSGGTMTFNNDASLVQVNNASVNSGNITYRRATTPMVAMDYTYWSSPVAGQTLFNMSPLTRFDKFITFNTATSTWVVLPSGTIMAAGKGYIVRAPQGHIANTTYTAPFVGVPHNGVITTPIVVAGANDLNLIGNPYPSAVDADMFLTANSAITVSTLYFWTHNTPVTNTNYVGTDYAIYNFAGGVGTAAGGGVGNSNVPNGTIAAAQGFFIKGKNAGGTATFNNAMRLNGQNNWFYRNDVGHSQSTTTLEKHRIWLQMSNAQGEYKQMLAGYIETATNEIDDMFDAELLEAGNPISLYSVLGANKLSIQGKALPFSNADLIPLGYRSAAAGTYEIAMSNFDGLFLDPATGIYLEDKAFNIIHDLRAGAYPFVAAEGTHDDRFVLRFTESTLAVNDNDMANNAVVVYKNNNGINIRTGSMPMKTVRIYDIRGRELMVKTNINATETTITNLTAASQVLLVQITGDDNTVVTRKIVY